MTHSLKTVALGLAILAAVPACTHTRDPLQRAAGGALIGAAGGSAGTACLRPPVAIHSAASAYGVLSD